MARHSLRGRKGGGGDQPVETRTPDNLRSEDTMEVLLGLGEGPCVGLANGLKSFFIGDTQLENSDGTLNFQDINVEFFPGYELPGEEIKMSLGGSSRSTAVGVNLFSGTSAIRPTHAGDIDSIDIRLIINSLYRQDSHGVYDAVISFTIEYKALSGTEWAMAVDANVNGKTTSSAVKEYRFDVPRIDEPYEIRVTKTSPLTR